MKAKFAMKKFGRFFVLTLALACLLGLAGCGGETDKNKDDTDPTAQDVQVNDDALWNRMPVNLSRMRSLRLRRLVLQT